MKSRVYIETTVASYLTARPSQDVIVAAHQRLTLDWWTNHRQRFDLYISETVLNEAAMHDPIVEEVRRIRDEHALQFNYDVDAILADNRHLFSGGNHPRVKLEPRRVATPASAAMQPEPANTAKSA